MFRKRILVSFVLNIRFLSHWLWLRHETLACYTISLYTNLEYLCYHHEIVKSWHYLMNSYWYYMSVTGCHLIYTLCASAVGLTHKRHSYPQHCCRVDHISTNATQTLFTRNKVTYSVAAKQFYVNKIYFNIIAICSCRRDYFLETT